MPRDSSRSRPRSSSRSTAAAWAGRSSRTTTIATELYLKRLIVGGLERVYEIGKDFRNEGVSFKHNPEFTVLEWYEAYADYQDVAARCEALVASVAQAVGASGFEPPWKRETLGGAISSRTGIDVYAQRDVRALREAMVAAGLD